MKKEILIEGMSCGHCVRRVENALMEMAEVQEVTVSLEEKKATVVLKEATEDNKLKDVIDDAGYTVVEIKDI